MDEKLGEDYEHWADALDLDFDRREILPGLYAGGLSYLREPNVRTPASKAGRKGSDRPGRLACADKIRELEHQAQLRQSFPLDQSDRARILSQWLWAGDE